MTIFKEGDGVRVKTNAYNINDRREGMLATVARVDEHDRLLPVRIEYPNGLFNWTNHESLELVTKAPSKHEVIGKDILDRMVELKDSIVARDAAVKLVVDQTEALDALLAQYGLKRGEEIPTAQVVQQFATLNALDAYTSNRIEVGDMFQCTKGGLDLYTNGKIYTVTAVDEHDDDDMPVAFEDDDGDDMYPEPEDLKAFIKVK